MPCGAIFRMQRLIYFTAILLGLAASPLSQSATPAQVCEIRTPSWCMIRSGLYFDARTINKSQRLWTLRGPYLEKEMINIVEDRACSSGHSDFQLRRESVGASKVDGTKKYIITWILRKDESCKMTIEIPVNENKKSEIAYELALRALKACADDRCSGPNLAASLSSKAPGN